MTISAAPPGAPGAPPGSIRVLVLGYLDEVKHRTKLGDSNAFYHSSAWKIRGYKLLMDSGYTPKGAIAAWRAVEAALKKAQPERWRSVPGAIRDEYERLLAEGWTEEDAAEDVS